MPLRFSLTAKPKGLRARNVINLASVPYIVITLLFIFRFIFQHCIIRSIQRLVQECDVCAIAPARSNKKQLSDAYDMHRLVCSIAVIIAKR